MHSQTPLIYRAVPSWFVRVEQIKEQLLANNEQTYWVPDNVKVGRFQSWLRDARDWAVSRNRYWGTPLPIWASEDFEEIVVVSSIAELAELTGQPAVTDLHRETVDGLTIPSKRPGQPPLKRVDEVLDCEWGAPVHTTRTRRSWYTCIFFVFAERCQKWNFLHVILCFLAAVASRIFPRLVLDCRASAYIVF